MRLKKFLEYFEFDYRYEDEYIALVDITEANLGDIESERFSKDNLSSIVDCLDIYYKDYIFDDLAEEYGVDPDDWQAIYQKAIKKNDPSLEYLKVIMGDEKVTLFNIIHDIEWDTDGEDIVLPQYMVIPEEIDEDDISDYISEETGFCHKGFKLGMLFIDCITLLQNCIDNKLLQFNAEIGNGSNLVYRSTGVENPEGWYWQNVLDAAAELFHSEMSQVELINEINIK